MTKSLVETFSCSLDDIDELRKAKETAHRNGLSFSAYVMELLKEENKKNGQTQSDDLSLSPLGKLTSDNGESLNVNLDGIIEVSIFTPSYDYTKAIGTLVKDINNKQILALANENFRVSYNIINTRIEKLKTVKKNIWNQ